MSRVELVSWEASRFNWRHEHPTATIPSNEARDQPSFAWRLIALVWELLAMPNGLSCWFLLQQAGLINFWGNRSRDRPIMTFFFLKVA